MKINTNLLNLITQILEAEMRYEKESEEGGDQRQFFSNELVRLKDAAVNELISSAPFATTYTKQTAIIKLGQTLELFKIHRPETSAEATPPKMSEADYAAEYAKATRVDNFDGASTQFPHLYCGDRHTGPSDLRGYVIEPNSKPK